MKIYVSILVFIFNIIIGNTDDSYEDSEGNIDGQLVPDNNDIIDDPGTENESKNVYGDDDDDDGGNDDVKNNYYKEIKEAIGSEEWSRLQETIKKARLEGIEKYFKHPLVKLPPWADKDQEPEQPRFPIHDPSYPRWEAGVYPKRPGKSKPSIYMYMPPSNGLLLKDDNPKLQKLSGAHEGYVPNKMSSGEVERYKNEVSVGDLTQILGNNLHIYQPSAYRLNDLGRRFVIQHVKDPDLKKLGKKSDQNSLIPKLAPPELVLAIAKESARQEALKPVDPDEYIQKGKALRSGNFWNSYWKEDVPDPLNILRSNQPEKMESLKVKLSPGSPIYEYVSKLNKQNPKLLYVINKKE